MKARLLWTRLALLFVLVALLALGGCKKRKARTAAPPLRQPNSSGGGGAPEEANDEPGGQGNVDGAGEGEDGADDDDQGAAGGGSGAIVDFSVQDVARAKAMEAAYTALIRGDATGVPRTLDLGADMMEVVTLAIDSGNVNAVSGGLKTLARLPLDPKHTALLKKGLAHAAPRVRTEAADAVAQVKAIAALPELLALLADAELEVRAVACDALAELAPTDESSLEALFARLSDSEDVVRASCSTAFAPTGTSDAWRNRVAALLLEKGIAKRDGALRVMSLWRDPTAFDLIRGRLADPDATIVAAALASLAPFGDVPTVREVSAFTTDERLAVRLEAVAALEQLPKDEVRNLVYEALKDRDPAIRVEAASQLARYPADPESYIRLHALLRDENPGVRASAAIAVADLANKRSFGPVLARLGEEKDELVLANLIDALGLADGPAAVPYLIDRIAESRGKEKSRIGAQLERITGEEIVLKPEAWKAWFEAKQHEAKQKGLQPQP